MSKWKVSKNIVGGEAVYGIYKLRDENETDHSGNRIEDSAVFKNKQKAQEWADIRNECEEMIRRD